MTNLELLPPVTTGHAPDYELSDDQMAELFVEETRKQAPSFDNQSTNILVVQGDTELANYARTLEARKLPTIPGLMTDYEGNSRFVFVLQDAGAEEEHNKPAHDKPAHVFRINYHDNMHRPSQEDTLTGLPTFDDLLKLEKVTEEQLLSYYDVASLPQLGGEYMNVESNIAVEGVKPSFKKPYSALGYKALFELVSFVHVRGIVAYQNEEAIQSLGHLNLSSHPIVGDPSIRVVDEDKAAIDGSTGEYFPLTIEGTPYSKLVDGTPLHNHRIFADEDYAASFSRIAGSIARKSIHILFIP